MKLYVRDGEHAVSLINAWNRNIYFGQEMKDVIVSIQEALVQRENWSQLQEVEGLVNAGANLQELLKNITGHQETAVMSILHVDLVWRKAPCFYQMGSVAVIKTFLITMKIQDNAMRLVSPIWDIYLFVISIFIFKCKIKNNYLELMRAQLLVFMELHALLEI